MTLGFLILDDKLLYVFKLIGSNYLSRGRMKIMNPRPAQQEDG